MAISLRGSVGTGGVNAREEVRTIQKMLNKVPFDWGGPSPKLVEDGYVGNLTRNAILRFQLVQLGSVQTPDGRIDPGKRALGRLNHICDSNVTATASVSVSAEPIAHFKQKTNMVCWAAAGTMLVAARDKAFTTIEVVMGTADANDPGYGYLAMYQGNKGLPPADTGRYTQSIGLRVGPPVNFNVQGWIALIRKHGAIGVVGLSPFLHIRVITEIKGDDSGFGTVVTVHDPGNTFAYEENFVTFAQRYEAAAGINARMHQIWHK